MTSVLFWLVAYVANAVWQVPFIAAGGWGVSRCCRRLGPQFQHKAWVAVLILATLAPVTPVFEHLLVHDTPAVSVPAPEVLARGAARPASLPAAGIILPLGGIYAAAGLYAVAVVFFLLRLGWLFRCTTALLRHARPALLEAEHMALWRRSKESFSMPAVSLLCSDSVPGPVIAGFRRPALLLPARFIDEHSPTDFLAAIGHECAHVERNDFRKNVFYEVLALLTAFHPVTWLIKSRIAQTRELVCDQMAAERLLDRRAYGQSLLRLAAGMAPRAQSAVFHTVGMFQANVLEGRVMAVMTAPPRMGGIRRYLLGGSAILLLSLCAGVGGWFAQPVAAQTAQEGSAGRSQQSAPDLSCTFYTEGVGSPGTCGFDKQDKTRYLCYSNQDPALRQLQVGCEYKLKRAAQARKK